MTKLSIGIAAATVWAAAGSAHAQVTVEPAEYDPGNWGVITAGWIAGTGLPTDDDGADYGLVLYKESKTAVPAAAVADIRGFDPFDAATITLGFDYQTGLHCSLGSPRFNVYTADLETHYFGCGYGKHVDAGVAGWRHVDFSAKDALPPLRPGDVVTGIQIIMDEGTDAEVSGETATPGYATLDNIIVNDAVVGRPADASDPDGAPHPPRPSPTLHRSTH